MSSLTADDVAKLKVTELRSELKARNLSVSGVKKDLADRLVEALQGGDSLDPAGQTSGEAPEIADKAEQSTDNLPSELPAVAPANEDSVQDLEGAEDPLEQDEASKDVETSGEASAVVRPENVKTVDATPGFVAETNDAKTIAVPDSEQVAPVLPVQEVPPAALDSTAEKRKRDDDVAVSASRAESKVEPVAVQDESAAVSNEAVPAPPTDVDQPELKRLKTEADVLPVNDAEMNGTDTVPSAASTNGTTLADPSNGTDAAPVADSTASESKTELV